MKRRENGASMGPGSFDPGSFIINPRKTDVIALQWGRGLSTPEVYVGVADEYVDNTLQWGRGLSTPEVTRSATAAGRRIWASMGPGSFDPGSDAKQTATVDVDTLQWGRGLSTPEVFCRRSLKPKT